MGLVPVKPRHSQDQTEVAQLQGKQLHQKIFPVRTIAIKKHRIPEHKDSLGKIQDQDHDAAP